LSPGGSGYITCIQNMKLVTTKFKSGGPHEKHVVATWNLRNHIRLYIYIYIYIYIYLFIYCGVAAQRGPGPPHSAGFYITRNDASQRPDNTQHSQQTNILAAGGIRTHGLSRRPAADLRLRARGHWDRHIRLYSDSNFVSSILKAYFLCYFHSIHPSESYIFFIIHSLCSWKILLNNIRTKQCTFCTLELLNKKYRNTLQYTTQNTYRTHICVHNTLCSLHHCTSKQVSVGSIIKCHSVLEVPSVLPNVSSPDCTQARRLYILLYFQFKKVTFAW